MGYSSSIQGYFARIPLQWWLLVGVIGILLSLILRKMYVTKRMSILQVVTSFFLFEYIFIILISTVLSRSSGNEYLYKLELFWSYRYFMEIGVIGVLFENVYNLLLLFPYGFLVKIIWKRLNAIWISATGTIISLIIEFLQLVLKRGYFELDDIFHNSLGVLLGYLTFSIMMRIREEKRRKVN